MMETPFDEGIEEKLKVLVQEIYDLEKWLEKNDDDKQDLLWVQLYAMQSYAAALKARCRALAHEPEFRKV